MAVDNPHYSTTEHIAFVSSITIDKGSSSSEERFLQIIIL